MRMLKVCCSTVGVGEAEEKMTVTQRVGVGLSSFLNRGQDKGMFG